MSPTAGRKARAPRQASDGGSRNSPLIDRGDLLAALDRAAARKVTIIRLRPAMALCRCGHSGNKPFGDGTHLTIDSDGTLAN